MKPSCHYLGMRMLRVSLATFCLINPSVVKAQEFRELVGEWVTRGGPQHASRLEIRRNRDTQDSVFGQGRIASTVEWGANYVIVYPGNRKCYLYISLSDREMNIEPKSTRTAVQDECIRGFFVRRTDSGRMR